jgi:hypothetical protein
MQALPGTARHCQALPGCAPAGHQVMLGFRTRVPLYRGECRTTPATWGCRAASHVCRPARHARGRAGGRGRPPSQSGPASDSAGQWARKRQCGRVGPQATVRESGPASDARGVGGGGGSGVVSSRLVATGEGHARAGWQVATTEGYTASQRRHPPPPAPAPTLRALPMAALVRARTHSGPRPHALPVQDDVRGLEAALLGQMVKHGGNVGLGHARGEGGREVAWFG